MYLHDPRLGIEPVTTTAVVTAAVPATANQFRRRRRRRRRPPPPPRPVAPPAAPAFGVPGWIWPLALGGGALALGAVFLARR